MAKYLAEKQYACLQCGIEARREEFIRNNTVLCPNCQHYACYKLVNCGTTDPIVVGTMTFRYKGYGKVPIPKIVIEELPQLSSNLHEMLCHSEPCSISTILDCARNYGWPQTMQGVDLIEGGDVFWIPFSSSNHLWIDGQPVNHMDFYDPDTQNWDIFLGNQQVECVDLSDRTRYNYPII